MLCLSGFELYSRWVPMMRPNAGCRKRKILVPRTLAQIILYKQEMARSMMLRQLLYVCTYCWSESNVKYI